MNGDSIHNTGGPFVSSFVMEHAQHTMLYLADAIQFSAAILIGLLAKDAKLAQFAGRVSDSGEGRWTIKAAIDEGVPVPLLTTALYARFASRGAAEFQGKLLSAMRYGFGGHLERSAK